MQQLVPSRTAPIPAEQLEVRLAELYQYPAVAERSSWLRACMVASADGASSVDGRSAGLSTPVDAALLGVLRALADVVLVGAGTARSEGYGPADVHPILSGLRVQAGQEPAPAIAVVSARLHNLRPDSPLLTSPPVSPGARTVVITTESAPAEAVRAIEDAADVVVVGRDQVDLDTAVQALASRGWHRILCEGGPQLLGQVQAAGLLDELCLTVAPLLVGGAVPRIAHSPAVSNEQMRLASLLTDDGFLFTRYVRHSPTLGRRIPV
ncbi:pyrimidine reductase family protein [Kitasatospora sp. MBT66]|uniref:pyrimidine reductase family protein n=1 Tax=Kitasatospora sp. MBT66 TaxID=1444769 RepID=UPI0005BE7E71|nr:pyrimidine reductase family protein [Kitasatospora sp. MBT66]